MRSKNKVALAVKLSISLVAVLWHLLLSNNFIVGTYIAIINESNHVSFLVLVCVNRDYI